MVNTVPTDANGTLYEGLRDPVGQQFVAKQASTVTVDGGGVSSSPEAVTIAASQINVPVQGGFLQVAGQGPGVVNGTNTDFIPAMDVSAYKWAAIQLTGTWSATLQVQGSNDNVNFVVFSVMLATAFTSNNYTNSLTQNTFYCAAIQYRYMRIRCSAFTSNASLAGNLELYTTPPPYTAIATQAANLTAATSGGTTDFHLISAATTNATSVKASAGQVYGYELGNNGAADAYVKLYNKASAPTVGTDTPLRTIYLPKGTSKSFHNSVGIPFATGIGLAIVANMVDSDATAVAANQVSVELDYK